MLKPEIFKSNDIRGLVWGPEIEWDVAGAYQLGAAFAQAFELAGQDFVIGHDMRKLGPKLAGAFIQGATEQGANAIEVGLASTDELWYASGALQAPGVQLTASHNPPQYNGVKFCRPLALPITPQFLTEIQRLSAGEFTKVSQPGTVRHQDILDDYATYLHSLVDLSNLRKLRVVVDAGNGMAGHTTGRVLGSIVEVIGLFLDLDGTFPNHQPNPLIEENLIDAKRAVVAEKADLGLVFDGDADRCFFIDERGELVDPSAIAALIAGELLKYEPGSAIVLNSITSKATSEYVEQIGGRVVVSPVGHSFIKTHMAKEQAIFGGEHSGHFYFRNFWGADTGMLAALNVIAFLGHGTASMSDLVADLPHYVGSGEINTSVENPLELMALVEQSFVGQGEVDHSDGLMIRNNDWWVSVRMSNTEPLLRLNVEAKTISQMAQLRDQALAIIRKENK